MKLFSNLQIKYKGYNLGILHKCLEIRLSVIGRRTILGARVQIPDSVIAHLIDCLDLAQWS